MSKKIEFETQTFNTDIGQKAQVERVTVQNTQADHYNERLKAIGDDMNHEPEHLTCIGSMAIHIYKSEKLGILQYMEQLCTEDVPEPVLSAAFVSLKGTAMERYKRKRPVKRSGF